MDDSLTTFDDLLMDVVGGTATKEECRRMAELMQDNPVFRERYLAQMRVHALLKCRSGRVCVFARPPQTAASRCDTPWRPLKQRKIVWWKKVAAAAAVMLAVTGVWRAADKGGGEKSNAEHRTLNIERRTGKSWTGGGSDSSVACPVTMVEWKWAWGLEMPRELPGRIRLAKGEAKVRLPSGVELALLGPLELESDERGMEVRLARGRLVAWVPTRASGFTVRAPGLTAWDIGTVFSVEAEADGSSLFVFKGSVQVLDGEGNGVDLCEAGEGVRALGGRTPFKVTAEGETAERLFKTVGGYAALAEPGKAFDAARQIGELWMAEYVPEEASRVRERTKRQAALRNAPKKIPFTKTAWVRPSVPAQQEERSMKTTSAAALAAAAVMMGAGTSGAVSEPVEVNTSQAENRYWETVYTNEVDVVWRWDDCPTNAAYAEFLIDGMGGTVLTTNVTRSVSNVLWRAFATQSPAAEDVFDLRLTFFDSGNLVVGAQTSRLAVVKGAFGATQVDPGPAETTAWRKVKENVAVPYDAGWAKATVVATNSRLVIAKQGGITQTNTTADTAGYIGWKVRRSDWGYGTFNLALTFPGTEGEWDATLTRVPEGMKIQVR